MMPKRVGVLWLASCALFSAPVSAKDLHALVIGIDEYATLTPLRGAVNDARDVAQTIESLGPASLTMLLNAQASRRAILNAWDAMAAKAKPGDTLFVSYAGHGVQIKEAVPGQEEDGYDEVWALGGFADSGPGSAERIVDDEWGERISAVPEDIKVVMLLDACHSGTMTRSAYAGAPPLPTRFGGKYDRIKGDALPPPPTRRDHSPGARPNEIYLGGVSDDRAVPEVMIGGQARGALSYYFSRGLRGQADVNGDGEVSLAELQGYLVQNVRQRTESQQTPVIQFAGDSTAGLFKVSKLTATAIPLRPVRIAIRATSADEGRRLSELLTQVEVVSLGAAELVWDLSRGRVLSSTGDWVANASSAAEMQGEVDKALTMMRLRAIAETKGFAGSVEGGDHRRQLGDEVTLTFEARRQPYLTIINLAGTGVVNMLYPVNAAEARPQRPEQPLMLGPLRVKPPFGADHVIAIASRSEPTLLRKALTALDGRRAATAAASLIEQASSDGAQQIAIVGLFTGDKK